MRRSLFWMGVVLLTGSMGQQLEHVVYIESGDSLPPLQFAQQTCLRLYQNSQPLGKQVCVDALGKGVLTLPTPQGSLEIPYKVDSLLSKAHYILRFSPSWGEQTPSPPEENGAAGEETPSPPEENGAAGEETDSRSEENGAAGEETSSPPEDNGAAGEETDSRSEENGAAGEETSSPPEDNGAAGEETDSRSSSNPTPTYSDKRAGARPEVLAHFYLRRTLVGWQIRYSLLARSELSTDLSALHLYLDGRSIQASLTRRFTGQQAGRLLPGEAEYGWIDLGELKGKRLRLEWPLGSELIKQEWEL